MVVVSVIALLLGLLMPSLRTAREQSRQVVCRSNLEDIWRGIYSYALDNNDRIPLLARRDPQLDPFDPRYPLLVGNVLGKMIERRSFICPSAVAGYPDEDPSSRYKWKLTYDFSTVDRLGDAVVGYDQAPGAYTGKYPDPAFVNDFHFDGRPMKRLNVQRFSFANWLQAQDAASDSVGPAGSSPSGSSGKAEVVSWPSVPLVADTLGEEKPGDLLAGRPRYPHRGIVRRQGDVYRSLVTTSDPRLVPSRQMGYFQMHAEGEHREVFLTRYSPETLMSGNPK